MIEPSDERVDAMLGSLIIAEEYLMSPLKAMNTFPNKIVMQLSDSYTEKQLRCIQLTFS